MPGDELVPEPSFNATQAITIAAPPEDVWPWIIQIGTGRAGFYSYDLFDNAACPSADRILPQFQHTCLGDWVPMPGKVNQMTAFKVTLFEPNQWLLWAKPQSTWAWTLTPVEGRHPPGHATEGAVSLALIAGTGPAHPDLVRVWRLPDDAQAPGRQQTAGGAAGRPTHGHGVETAVMCATTGQRTRGPGRVASCSEEASPERVPPRGWARRAAGATGRW
jgi:hypothetical protein